MSRLSTRVLAATGSVLVLAALPAAVSAGLLDGLLGDSSAQSTTQDSNTTPQTDQNAKGYFSLPFEEPTIVVDGQVIQTDDKCITRGDGMDECKPAAGTMALLKDGRLLYLNALEGTENVELSIVAEFGDGYQRPKFMSPLCVQVLFLASKMREFFRPSSSATPTGRPSMPGSE